MIRRLRSTFLPNIVLAVSNGQNPAGKPTLLEGKTSTHGMPAAYVCEHGVCKMPVTDAAGVSAQAESFRPLAQKIDFLGRKSYNQFPMIRLVLLAGFILILILGVAAPTMACDNECQCPDCDQSSMCMPEDDYVSTLPSGPADHLSANNSVGGEWDYSVPEDNCDDVADDIESSLLTSPLFVQFQSLLI